MSQYEEMLIFPKSECTAVLYANNVAYWIEDICKEEPHRSDLDEIQLYFEPMIERTEQKYQEQIRRIDWTFLQRARRAQTELTRPIWPMNAIRNIFGLAKI